MKRFFAILLCWILYKMGISVAINIASPDGRLLPLKNKIAVAFDSRARQFENWNYGRYLMALCDKDSFCEKCDLYKECALFIEFEKNGKGV